MKIKIALLIASLLVTISSCLANPPCVTNFTIVQTFYDSRTSVVLNNSDPLCSPSHPDQFTWIGACILATGTSCTNLTGGSTLSVNLGYVPIYDTDIGYCFVQCTNGHVQAHRMHIIVPWGHQKADFKFYADCDAISTCDDVVCVTPL